MTWNGILQFCYHESLNVGHDATHGFFFTLHTHGLPIIFIFIPSLWSPLYHAGFKYLIFTKQELS